jgi:hypothetical protein
MYHLMPEHWEFVHLHSALVFPIDALVSNQSCSSNHIRCHAIADEQNNILRPLLLLEGSNDPLGYCLGAIVVCECSNILTRIIKSHSSVDLGGHANDGRGMGILCKQVLIPSEVPALEGRFRNLEECWSRLRGSSNLLYSERKVGIWHTSIGLCTIDGSVDLPSSVRALPGRLRPTSNRISKYCPARKSV